MPNLYDVIDQFPLYCGVNTLGKALAVYEIFKKTLNVPGHLVEFGCYKGSNLLLIGKLLQLLQPNTYKYLWGFDSFEGLKTFSEEDGYADGEMPLGAYQGDEKTLRAMLDLYDVNDFVSLVKGDAMDTIPEFEKSHPHVMFSFAYIDFDLYKPCEEALRFLHERLSPGELSPLTRRYCMHGQEKGRPCVNSWKHIPDYTGWRRFRLHVSQQLS